MFGKSLYLATALSICSISVSFAAISKVEAQVELQVGNRTGKGTFIINSETYTQLSMDNEELGFAIKLVDDKEGDERFETAPTYNNNLIANFFITGKQTRLGAGCKINGHTFEKELIIKFLAVKKIS